MKTAIVILCLFALSVAGMESAASRMRARIRPDSRSDHFCDSSARAIDADIGLFEALVRTLQLNPLPDETVEDPLADFLILGRETVRVVQPIRRGVESLSRIQQPLSLLLTRRAERSLPVILIVRSADVVSRMTRSTRQQEVAV